MMRRNRILALTLVCCLCLSVAACADPGSSQPVSAPSSSGQASGGSVAGAPNGQEDTPGSSTAPGSQAPQAQSGTAGSGSSASQMPGGSGAADSSQADASQPPADATGSTTIVDKRGDVYTLSKPWKGTETSEVMTGDGTETLTIHHIDDDTVITLPDIDQSFDVYAILSVSDMGDVEECYRTFPGGTSIVASELSTSDQTGAVYEDNYVIYSNWTDDLTGETFGFRVVSD